MTSRPIEDLRPGDLVQSRSEFDPAGPPSLQRVEEVFVRQAAVLEVTINGRLIGTTAEHPFWVEHQGWTPAGDLRPGDRVACEVSGEWAVVTSIHATGRVQDVYNLRIAEFATYFVGAEEWGFGVWVHNAYTLLQNATQVGWLPNGGKANSALSNATLFKRDANGAIT